MQTPQQLTFLRLQFLLGLLLLAISLGGLVLLLALYAYRPSRPSNRRDPAPVDSGRAVASRELPGPARPRQGCERSSHPCGQTLDPSDRGQVRGHRSPPVGEEQPTNDPTPEGGEAIEQP